MMSGVVKNKSGTIVISFASQSFSYGFASELSALIF